MYRKFSKSMSMLVVAMFLGGSLFASASHATSLGVYEGNGCDGVKQVKVFAAWFGRQPDFMVDFFAMDSWTSMMNDANWTVYCWSKQQVKVVYSVPMLVNGGYTLAQGAAGNFDATYKQLAEMLVKNGYGDAVIRLGWEFNGGWYPWAAKKDPTNFVKYWQRIVTTMRSVSGAKFRFNWCMAQGWQQIPAGQVYPGDDYVDIIGTDLYNQTWAPNVTTPEQRWNDLLTQSYGLNWIRQFAQTHNKPLSIPEWGTGTRPDGHGGGDDPYFITHMAAWIKQNNVSFHGYWDFPASDFNARISTGTKPLSAAAFLAAFGTVAEAPSSVAVKPGT